MKLNINHLKYWLRRGWLHKKQVLIFLGAVLVLATVALSGVVLFKKWQDSRKIPTLQFSEEEKKQIAADYKKFNQTSLKPDAKPQEVYDYHIMKGAFLSNLGKQDEAISEYQLAFNSGVTPDYYYYLDLGLAYERKRDFKDARVQYQKAVDTVQSSNLSQDDKKGALDEISVYQARVK